MFCLEELCKIYVIGRILLSRNSDYLNTIDYFCSNEKSCEKIVGGQLSADRLNAAIFRVFHQAISEVFSRLSHPMVLDQSDRI